MMIKLKQTEALDLLGILKSVPTEKLAVDGKKKYKALTLKRFVVKELEEKNKEWLDLIKQASEINKKGITDLNEFKKELQEANPGSEETPEMKDAREEQEKIAMEEIVKNHATLGVKALYYRTLSLTRFEPINAENDKDIEIELSEEEKKNQLEFVKDIIERVALDVYPLETEVATLGDKLKVCLKD